MKAGKHFVAGFAAVLLWTRTAAGSDPQAILDALPTEHSLGPGWTRESILLFDPFSTPPEILHTSSQLPEAFKKERRASVEDPKGTVSGWSHTHFTFQTTDRGFLYDVQIERYRNQDHLKENFDRLLTGGYEQYQKTPVNGLGDAAVFYHPTKGFTATVWFRRADFMISISMLASLTNWEQDGNLQHLARILDQQIVRGSVQPGGSAKSKAK